MRLVKESGNILMHFDSPADAANAASACEGAEPWRQHVDKAMSRGGDRYFGNSAKSFTELVQYASTGVDAAGVAAASIDVNKVQMRESPKDVFGGVYAQAGAEVDVALFLSGEPEHMIDFPLYEAPKAGRVVSLLVGIGGNASVKAKALQTFGSRVMEAVLGLEGIGLEVEVVVGEVASSSGSSISSRVKVKGAGEFLDPTALMFPITDPAFFRGICLANMWNAPKSLWPSYGMDRGSSAHLGRQGDIHSIALDHEVVIPPIVSNSDADKDILSDLLAQLYGE